MIDNLNKFEIAEKLEELIKYLHDPEVNMFDFPKKVYDEMINMPRDKEGGVPKYYLSSTLKDMLELHEELKSKYM
ncbi:hypothetical protein [Virgibacillus phage Mimir87]|nr:hypothetical protein [Virgibacillus phage Mimir87]